MRFYDVLVNRSVPTEANRGLTSYKLAVVTRRKSRKRKQIQQGGTIEYGTAAAQVAAEALQTPQQLKKACGSSDQETAQPAVQRCGNCSRTGHNTQTCKKIQSYLLNQILA
jgi:hypothetical protein